MTADHMRVALHSDLREHGDQATVYRETLDLFGYAEELGFDTAWVRSYKFRRRGGAPGFSFPRGLPSPFPFLGALAARTARIRLGTAVVPLPLENIVRLAEDAAVVDALSRGRLELGVSNGGQPAVAAALGVELGTDREQKKARYLSSLAALAAILDGGPVNGTDQELNPPAPGLSGRIWEKAAVINVHYGTPEQIAESIRAFPAFRYTTELQFSVAYGTTSYAQRRAAVEAVASEIAPALGWKPDDGISRA